MSSDRRRTLLRIGASLLAGVALLVAWRVFIEPARFEVSTRAGGSRDDDSGSGAPRGEASRSEGEGGSEPTRSSSNSPSAEPSRIALEREAERTAVSPTALAGRVIDEAGEPIPKARVLALASGGDTLLPRDAPDDLANGVKRLLADEQGRFEIELGADVPAIDVVADADGYGPSHGLGVRAGDRLVLTLVRARRLRGVVRDRDGNPVAGATVRIGGYAERAWVERSTRSGADGSYELLTFPSGGGWAAPVVLTRLEARKEGYASDETTAVSSLVLEQVVNDGVRDFVLARGFTIEGRVVDALTGRSIAGARVQLDFWRFEGGSTRAMSSVPSASAATRSGSDGSFLFEQQSSDRGRGPARLVADAEGYVASRRDVERARDGELAKVEIPLWPELLVRGRVIDALGRPIEGATLQLTQDLDRERVEPWLNTDAAPPRSTSGRDGRFELVTARGGTPASKGALRCRFERSRGYVAAVSRLGVEIETSRDSPLDVGDLTVDRPPQLELRVVDEAGRALPKAWMRFGDGIDFGILDRADPEGRIFVVGGREELERPPESRWALVGASGFSTKVVGPLAFSTSPRDAAVASIVVALSRALSISGRVTGLPRGERVLISVIAPLEVVSLEPGARPPATNEELSRTLSGSMLAPDGSFHVGELPSGPCTVELRLFRRLVLGGESETPDQAFPGVQAGARDLVLEVNEAPTPPSSGR
jgi:protocatechuate 3,4-dioxygenase beta subunit